MLDSGIVPSGVEPQPHDSTLMLHSMTPESASATHYFYCFTRGYRVDDVELTKAIKALLEAAFVEEDKPMIEAQQCMMGTSDLWALRPALLAIDNAAVRARRQLEKLIACERNAMSDEKNESEVVLASTSESRQRTGRPTDARMPAAHSDD